VEGGGGNRKRDIRSLNRTAVGAADGGSKLLALRIKGSIDRNGGNYPSPTGITESNGGEDKARSDIHI